MADGADNRLTNRRLREIAGSYFDDESDGRLNQVANAAEDLAQTDQMPFREAVLIKAGRATKSYGDPRIK